MKLKLLFLFTIISTSIYSQKFKDGYIINKKDEKIDVLIKDEDWYNSPNHFFYRISLEDKQIKATTTDVKEFGLNNESNYVSYKGKLDISPKEVINPNFSTTRNPEWYETQTFLKVINSGETPLYEYNGNGFTRYYYKNKQNEIIPLIYKTYLIDGSNKIGENNEFKNQLKVIFAGSDVNASDIESAKYDKNSLGRLFSKLNNNQSNKTAKRKIDFNLSVRPGLNYSNLNLTANYDFSSKFSSKAVFRAGLEFEFVFPYGNNRISAIIEPNFTTYKNHSVSSTTNNITFDANLTLIEFPIGVRYYFPIDDRSKIFVNSLISVTTSVSGKFNYQRIIGNTDFTTQGQMEIYELRSGLIFGGGYNFNQKFSIEARFATKQNLSFKTRAYEGNYNYTSLIVGYNIF